MAEEKGGARFGKQCENTFPRIFGETQGSGEAREFGSGNLFPAQDEGRIAESSAVHGRGGGKLGIRAHRIGTAPPGNGGIGRDLSAFGHLRHGPIMRASPPLKQEKPSKQDRLNARLLYWYDRHRRVLPWRTQPGTRPNPYLVWLSEIMLQQTTVQAVGSYFRKFIAAWPDVESLAAASQEEVLAAWAGLGYYARARNLHCTAGIVAREMGGRFPATAAALRALPGVGRYTAGAVAAIAFDQPNAAMDANAERVIARLYGLKTPLPAAKNELHRLGEALVPAKRAGDFVQALMDLGAGVCTPKRPACARCPWQGDCAAHRLGIEEKLPVKAQKTVRPIRRGAAFVAQDASGAVLLVKRPEKGLLGAMLQPPLGPWSARFPSAGAALRQAPFLAKWKKRPGIVRHVFTHFELEVEVYAALVAEHPGPGRWVRDLSGVALPTVMKKIIAHAIADDGLSSGKIRA